MECYTVSFKPFTENNTESFKHFKGNMFSASHLSKHNCHRSATISSPFYQFTLSYGAGLSPTWTPTENSTTTPKSENQGGGGNRRPHWFDWVPGWAIALLVLTAVILLLLIILFILLVRTTQKHPKNINKYLSSQTR